MSLGRSGPDEPLNRELMDVSRDADEILAYFRAPNAIPDSFPTRQLVEICRSLKELPDGSAEGCRTPLEYARWRLPQIRREHFLSEEHLPPLVDEDEPPPLVRGMELDRLLVSLIGAVTTALDEYRHQAAEEFDDTVGPELVVDVPDDDNIRAAVAKSRSAETALRTAGDEIREITVPGSSGADQLLRAVKDAEVLHRLARAELAMKSVVLRWYGAVVDKLQDYPRLIHGLGDAIVIGVDVARAFIKRWDDFWSDAGDFVLKQIGDTGKMFAEVARILEQHRPRTSDMPHEEAVDPRGIKAEREARDLILSGKPVPPEIAAWVKRLNLSGERDAPTVVPDFGLVARLSGISELDIMFSNVETLDFVERLSSLTYLNVHASEASDLTPLAGLSGLAALSMHTDQASDLSPLAGLTGLTSLHLYIFQASDLAPLAGLTGLTSLSVHASQARNLSPLSSLTGLTSLNLHADRASDLSPLAGLTGLTSLTVRSNQMSDLSPLMSLIGLTSLIVDSKQLNDLSPLSSLNGLISLIVDYNQVNDLSPLAGLTGLTSLSVRANQVNDLTPLASLTGLTSLAISFCDVTDLSPLRNLKNLVALKAKGISVTDWGPVAHVAKVER